MIAEILFFGSLMTAGCAYAVHKKLAAVPPEIEIEVELHAERQVGEVLMYPFGQYVCLDDCYAVLVMEDVGGGYYRVCTFHECPKCLVLHTTQLYTKSEIENRSRLVIGV